jgi:pyruvate dehydrogenase E2 component (dihydrolipoamide acetyltransferase)
MPANIVVPQVGEAVAEVVLLEWLKKPGDKVVKGEVVFRLDTDKAVVEVEAFADGVLAEVLVPAGSPVQPQQVVGRLDDGAGEGAAQPSPNTVSAQEAARRQRAASPLALRVARELGVDVDQAHGTGPAGQITAEDVRRLAAGQAPSADAGPAPRPSRRIAVAPRARERARALGVDLTQVIGTGENGLITTRDVEAAAQASGENAVPAPSVQAIPYSRRRQAIARRMQASKQTVPHFYVTVDANMAQAQRLRTHCVDELGWEQPPTYTDILVQACALALAAMPNLNAAYSPEGALPRPSADIGVAVGLDDGLVVPVLAGADQLSLSETSRRLKQMIERARQGSLTQSDLGPKSMVVSNLGIYGVDAFIAIIDPPDPMILAAGRVADRVVPGEGGQPVVAPYCTLTLSADHRALDGVLAAKFLGRVVRHIENAFDLLE